MKKYKLSMLLLILAVQALGVPSATAQVTNPQTGSFGLSATLPTEAPKFAPTIAVPRSGQAFTANPVTMSGVCQSDLLVKVFKNGIFSGSVQCRNNSYSLSVDLFSGRNDIVVRQYDALDQSSPPSTSTVVTFDDGGDGIPVIDSVTIASQYAIRGADPGKTLRWPLVIAGGTAPYAVTVDWGDGKSDLKTLLTAGEFDVEHIYESPGIYAVVIRVSDAAGASAYLQLVAQANGAIAEQTKPTIEQTPVTINKVVWWPFVALPIAMLSTFWLGTLYQFTKIKRLIKLGKYPFQ